MKNKTYYTVYKVTNKVNGKVYIGCHKTRNLDDGYMGSGKYLKRAIEKHGIGKFTKEILFVYDNPKDMFLKEAEIVTEEFISEENTYNLKIGGVGGFDYINVTGINNKSKQQEKATKASAEARKRFPEKYKNSFEDSGKRMKSHHKNGLIKYNNFLGKTHSDETKNKISNARKGKVSGKDNPSFGSMWIYNIELKQSKKIRKEDFLEWENKGWKKGRKIKFDHV